MMKILKISCIILLLSSSCTDEFFELDACTDVVIKKDKHYSDLMSRALEDDFLNYRVTFTESCRYDIGAEQADWNKLFGVSLGSLDPHQNSVRWVWRYNPETDLIEIAPYTYVNSVRTMYEPMYQIAIGEAIDLKLRIYSKYVRVNEMNFEIKTKTSIRSTLNPYFGGNIAAPHDIRIQMCRI